MPNIASMLKAEIVRLARKEIRNETAALRKASTSHRSQIAALKREVTALQRQAKGLAKQVPGARSGADEEASENRVRFVAKGFRSMRTRLGLSAAELAILLQVSPQSVYNWEHEKSVPRRSQVESIAALRSIGKKEARERLASAQGTDGKRRRKARAKAA
ncbi:MAG: XRE family transcriptional regulator [Lysobacteraceae bacterium]|nr:MAG: XRE family transcriptional regulator [Xanthomonadaceae bacterium]